MYKSMATLTDRYSLTYLSGDPASSSKAGSLGAGSSAAHSPNGRFVVEQFVEGQLAETGKLSKCNSSNGLKTIRGKS